MICSSRFYRERETGLVIRHTHTHTPTPILGREPIYLEPLILQDSLDGSIFPARSHLGLKHNTERTIAHNLALSVGDLLGFAGESILDLLADDLLRERLDL